MEAPKGIQILAEAGDIQAICRNELRLESKDGEVSPARFSWKLKAAHFLGLGSYRCSMPAENFFILDSGSSSTLVESNQSNQ